MNTVAQTVVPGCSSIFWVGSDCTLRLSGMARWMPAASKLTFSQVQGQKEITKLSFATVPG